MSDGDSQADVDVLTLWHRLHFPAVLVPDEPATMLGDLYQVITGQPASFQFAPSVA